MPPYFDQDVNDVSNQWYLPEHNDEEKPQRFPHWFLFMLSGQVIEASQGTKLMYVR